MRRPDVMLLEGAHNATAGAILRALHAAYGVPSEAVQRLMTSPDGTWLTMDAHEGRRLLTPCPLPMGPNGRGLLRRESDLPAAAPPWVVTLAGSARTAGALATDLHKAGAVCGEDLGVIRKDNGNQHVELPRWRYRQADLGFEVDGQRVSVEKKKSDRRITRPGGRPLRVESAAEALRRVAGTEPSPAQLAAATRQALRRARGDEVLDEAARRLSRTGFQVARAENVNPALLILTLALEPAARWRSELDLYTNTPFPGADQTVACERLNALLREHRGELETGHPASVGSVATGLETRALGTVCPGLKPLAQAGAASAVPLPDDADLWAEWQAITASVYTPQGLDPAHLRTFDVRVREACDEAGVDLCRWPDLVDLLANEAAGRATPLTTALGDLEPDAPRYVDAATRTIDALVREGRWPEAGSLAAGAHAHHPESIRLARRRLRLTHQTVATVDDDTALVLAAEAALRAGRSVLAESALLACHPPPGTPAAQHAARRLLDAGLANEAWERLASGDPPELRLRAALAGQRFEDATTAWAQLQGDQLGLTPVPDWADAGVLGELPTEFSQLLEGQRWDAPALPATAPVGGPVEAAALVFDTPDPQEPLARLCATLTVETWPVWRGLVLHLVREVPESDWRRETVRHVASLVSRVPAASEAARALGGMLLIEWLKGKDPVLRVAAVELSAAVETRTDELSSALEHTPEHRLSSAESLLSSERFDEAVQVALSVARKAQTSQVRRRALQLVLAAGREDALNPGLAADRPAGLAHDVLAVLTSQTKTTQSLSEEARACAAALAQDEAVAPRVREAANELLSGESVGDGASLN